MYVMYLSNHKSNSIKFGKGSIQSVEFPLSLKQLYYTSTSMHDGQNSYQS